MSLLFCTAVTASYAQHDDLINEIMSKPSLPTLISNGRQAFIENLQAGDVRKAAQIRDMLIEKTANTRYSAFSNREYLLSLYWTEDYDLILVTALLIDSLPERAEGFIIPREDGMEEMLENYSLESKQRLISQLDIAILDTPDKDFLRLLLSSLLMDDSKYALYRVITRDSEQYLDKYPSSPYRSFVLKHVCYKFESDPWGFGASLGMGVSIPSADLSQLCRTGFNAMLGFDAMYRKLYMGLYLGINGADKIKTPVTVKGHDIPTDFSWLEGNMMLNFGYCALDNNTIRVVPYVGAGGSWMTFSNGEQERDRISYSTPWALKKGAGVYCDFKINTPDMINELVGKKNNYTSVRVRYNYGEANYNIPGLDRCALHSISLEWGGFGRQLHRITY